ncbi:hypothetical protein C8R44DRAFT_726365 [Mycena epipterygia]|nr:hypothetical protein C8R44DRAFT_726365 [Mycena epipterygia]
MSCYHLPGGESKIQRHHIFTFFKIFNMACTERENDLSLKFQYKVQLEWRKVKQHTIRRRFQHRLRCFKVTVERYAKNVLAEKELMQRTQKRFGELDDLPDNKNNKRDRESIVPPQYWHLALTRMFAIKESTPAVLYLVAAIGPPPPELVRCNYGYKHTFNIFSSQQNRAQGRGQARLGHWTAYCKTGSKLTINRCIPPSIPMPDPERCATLLAGMEELKARLKEERPIKIDAQTMATQMGRSARMAWEVTRAALNVEADEDDNGAPLRKKARTESAPVANGNGTIGVHRSGKGKSKATAPRAKQAQDDAAPTRGKGKGKAIVPRAKKAQDMPVVPVFLVDEYDQYSALAYATVGMPTRIVTLIVYNQAHTKPLQYVVFDCKASQGHWAAQLRLVRALLCVRTDLHTGDTPANRHNTSRPLYALEGSCPWTTDACPGIAEWKERVEASANAGELPLPRAELAANDIVEVLSSDEEPEGNDEQVFDEDDDEVQILSSSFSHGGSTSQATSSFATRGGGQPSSQPSNGSARKRARPEFMEGSSNKPYESDWMQEQEDWMGKQ